MLIVASLANLIGLALLAFFFMYHGTEFAIAAVVYLAAIVISFFLARRSPLSQAAIYAYLLLVAFISLLASIGAPVIRDLVSFDPNEIYWQITISEGLGDIVRSFLLAMVLYGVIFVPNLLWFQGSASEPKDA